MDIITQNWLDSLCNIVTGVTAGAVYLRTTEKNGYQLSVFWPDKPDDHQELSEAAKAAIASNKPILIDNKSVNEDTGERRDIISCPIYLDEQPYGAVALQMFSRVAVKRQTVMQQITAAAYWYEAIQKQSSSVEKKQLVTIVELVASCLEHDKFKEAATDVATDLTTRVSADRVSIGFVEGNGISVEAISHSAGFDAKSNLVADIVEAMHEAIDQNSIITYPKTKDSPLPTHCHATLVNSHRIGNVLTVPFAANGELAGAVLFERPVLQPFDKSSIEHCEQIVLMIGPVLNVRRHNECGLIRRIRRSVASAASKISRSTSLKVMIGMLMAGLAVLFLVEKDYRITGDARLEAQAQRVIVSPQAGYIATANIRPGDIVHSGDVLGTLDDKDIILELRKWSSQYDQLRSEYRDALARHDRSSVGIIQARIAQTEAQLNLVREQQIRTQFTAPFDGLVVSGDLSQSLGAPVERGQVLFAVAPLDVYRIILQIDERDIGEIREGQSGSLVLSSVPGKPMGFTVGKITPVSITEEGRNFFQVEAKIKEESGLLRPGMEGVAKVTVDKRKLGWIWTHRFFDWARLMFWSIIP